MGSFDCSQVALSAVCRSCLIKKDQMIYLLSKNAETNQIIVMLSTVANFEIELNEFLPRYLCKDCEEKLRLSYEFQMLVHKSNEIIALTVSDSEQKCIKREPAVESMSCFKCAKCQHQFSTKRHLEKHTKIHQKANQKYCKLCVRKVRSLPQHLQTVHVNRRKKPEGELCPLCGIKVSCLAKLRLHMRTHTGETPYQCHFCERRMANRHHLKLHERTHTGEKPYTCQVCSRSFAQSSVLNTHMKIHVGRPEVCDVCQKRFCRKAELRLHMRSHTGEKPYECPECSKAFKQQSHLSEHLKRHSDERPYKCSHCDKTFKQMCVLKTHLTIHTGERPFRCSQCPYASRQRHGLTQHMKQHTVDKPNPTKPHFCHLCQKGYSTVAMLMSHNALMHTSVATLQPF